MTKERAIELLKNFNLYDEPNCMGYWDCDECVEALYMGIEAIQQMPIVRCVDCKYLELKDFVNGICKHRTGTVSPDGYCDKGEKR